MSYHYSNTGTTGRLAATLAANLSAPFTICMAFSQQQAFAGGGSIFSLLGDTWANTGSGDDRLFARMYHTTDNMLTYAYDSLGGGFDYINNSGGGPWTNGVWYHYMLRVGASAKPGHSVTFNDAGSADGVLHEDAGGTWAVVNMVDLVELIIGNRYDSNKDNLKNCRVGEMWVRKNLASHADFESWAAGANPLSKALCPVADRVAYYPMRDDLVDAFGIQPDLTITGAYISQNADHPTVDDPPSEGTVIDVALGTLSLTPQAAAVQANVDTNIAAGKSQLFLTPQQATIEALQDTNIGADSRALALAPQLAKPGLVVPIVANHDSVAPQLDGRVDYGQPYGAPGTPTDPDPPVLLSPIPTLSPQVGEPFSYDIAAHFDGSPPLSFSTTDVPRSGLTLSTAGLLEGPATAQDNFPITITCTDPFDQTAETTFTVNIQDAPAETGRPWNFPNVRAAFPSSGSNQVVYQSEGSATQKAQLYRAVAIVTQFRGFESAAVRRNTRAEMLHIDQRKLAGVPMLVHMNLLPILAPRQPSGRLEWFPAYDYARQNKDEAIARNNNDTYLGRRTSASAPDRYLAASFRPGLTDHVATEWTNALDNFGTDHDLLELFAGWLNDGFRIKDGKKCETQFLGAISAIGGSGNREITVPYWPGLPLDGSPDGNGFEGLTSTLWPWFRTTNDFAADRAVKRAKHNGTSSTTLLIQDPLDSAVSTGWTCELMSASGETTRVDWDRDGTDPGYSSSDHGAGSEAADRAALWMAWLDVLRDKRNAALIARGLPAADCGRAYNTVSGSALEKWLNGLPVQHALIESGDIVHCEHFETGRNDTSEFAANDSGGYSYGLTSSNDLRFYLQRLPLGASFLRRQAPANALNRRGAIGSVSLKHGDIDNHSPTMLAHAAAWETFLVMAGGGAWWPHILHTDVFRWQASTGLMIVALNGAPIQPATAFTTPIEDNTDDWLADSTDPYALQWGLHQSYDPAGNGNKGSLIFRPGDWGAGEVGQWEMWFKDQIGRVIVLALNWRLVSSNIADWVPWYLPGGVAIDAAKDTFIVHDVPAGKEMRTLDLLSYENPENGEKLTEGVFAQIDGEPVNIQIETDLYPNVPGNPPGLGELVGGTGQNGATTEIGVGSPRWFIIADAL